MRAWGLVCFATLLGCRTPKPDAVADSGVDGDDGSDSAAGTDTADGDPAGDGGEGDGGEGADSGDGTDSGSSSDTGSSADTGEGADSGAAPVDADGDGWTDIGGDCDDTDPAVNPDAEEVCDNGVDDDCDGTSNDCGLSGEITTSHADGMRYGPTERTKAGEGVYGVGDLDADGRNDVAILAHSTDGYYGDGAVWFVYGPMSGTAALSTADATLWGDNDLDASLGSPVAPAGDQDGDGWPDVWVATDDAETPSFVHLYLGPITGTLDVGAPSLVLDGHQEHEDQFGRDLAAGGLRRRWQPGHLRDGDVHRLHGEELWRRPHLPRSGDGGSVGRRPRRPGLWQRGPVCREPRRVGGRRSGRGWGRRHRAGL